MYMSHAGSDVESFKSIAANAAKAFFTKRLTKELEKRFNPKQTDAAGQVIACAYEEWFTTMRMSLRMQGYDENELKNFFQAYHNDLEKFLADTDVAEELLKPFTSAVAKTDIDRKRLLRRWQILHLRPLPEDMDTAAICRAYPQRVKKAGIVKPDLFKLFKLLAQEHSEYLEAIRDFWPDDNLENYASRIKKRYRALDLSALTLPAHDDLEIQPVLLRDVFIPQNAQESHPLREQPEGPGEKIQQAGKTDTEALSKEWRKAQSLQNSGPKNPPEPVLAALAKKKNKHTVLLGDPGSGKSTLARYLLLSVLEPPRDMNGRVAPWIDAFKGHLPLLVELRRYMGVMMENPSCKNFIKYFYHVEKIEKYGLLYLDSQPKDGQSLENEQKKKLVELLLKCPCIKDRGVRQSLLKQLPDFIADAITAYDNAKEHVTNIVDTCVAYENGLNFLVDNIGFFDGETIPFQNLTTFMAKFANKDSVNGSPPQTKGLLKLSKKQLKTYPSFVIFDGLDEIFDPKQREVISHKIIRFANSYPNSRILVTSRSIGYRGKPFLDADFQEYTLQDLDEQQIQTFVRGWFRLKFPDKPDEAEFRQQRILNAISDSPAICQLAGNPLLLTIIAIIAKHQELPRDRAKLYEHASKVLCHHWDVTGHRIPVEETLADFMREDDKLELLRYIARRMQSGPKGLAGNFILATELLEEVEKYMAHRWQLQPVDARRVGLAVINQLRERNFILCLWEKDVYGFVHRAFLEYFCAMDIVHRFTNWRELTFEQLQSDIFLKNYQDNAWHEVLRLICGLVAPRFAGGLIDAIVPKGTQAFKKTDALILAIQCLSETGNLNEIRETASQVLEGIMGWFEYQDKHKAVEAVKKEQAFLESAVPAVENIGAGWPGREVVVEWLPDPKKEICSFNGAHAFGRIIKALCSEHEKTKDGLITLSDIISRKADSYMAFDALARCFGKQKEIYSLLCHRAIEGEHEGIRAAALSTLAEHYVDEVEAVDTCGLLRQRAVEDDDWYVRSTALGVLAKYYTDSSDTRSLVRKQAVEDRHENVRDTALRILVKHYDDAPDTYALLEQCASGDEHERIRSAAMGGLLKYHEEWERWQILLSRDLDKREPWLDAIDERQLAKAVRKLKKPRVEVYREYESIARKLPIKLNWKEGSVPMLMCGDATV